MNRKVLVAFIIIVSLRVILFAAALKDLKILLPMLVSAVGIILIQKKLKKSWLLYPILIIFVLLISNFYKPIHLGFNDNPAPLWLTDEQRREHGANYNSFWVVGMHNKAVNYTLSFLETYTNYFRGDFLFTNGTYLYLFDWLFIGTGLWVIIKSPKGWKVILIWFIIAPFLPALDFQPPSPVKAAGMFLPLVIISTFGAGYLLKKLSIIKV